MSGPSPSRKRQIDTNEESSSSNCEDLPKAKKGRYEATGYVYPSLRVRERKPRSLNLHLEFAAEDSSEFTDTDEDDHFPSPKKSGMLQLHNNGGTTVNNLHSVTLTDKNMIMRKFYK